MSKYNRIAEDKQQLQQFADKVSANGWDKLGVIVLPVPHSTEMTWDAYKETYGIDLEKLFIVTKLGDEYIVKPNPSVTKLILLAPVKEYFADDVRVVPMPLFVPDYATLPAKNIAEANMNLGITELNSTLTISITIYANKTVLGEFA